MLKDARAPELQLENALFFASTDGAVFIEPLDVRALVDYAARRLAGAADRRHRRRARPRRPPRAREHSAQPAAERRRPRPRARRVAHRHHAASPAPSRSSSPTTALARRSDVRPRWTGRSFGPTATSGSGVGLFVCRGLLRQMQGQIRAAWRRADRDSAVSLRAAGGRLMARVLLVEDDRSLGQTLAERLDQGRPRRRVGRHVRAGASGRGAPAPGTSPSST